MAETYRRAEKRKHPRCEEHVFISYSASRIPEIRSSATRNLSGAGLCFESEIGFSPGDVLTLKIYKPIDTTLENVFLIYTTGEVKWIKEVDAGKYELGVEFLEIAKRDRDRIIKNVKGKLKR